MGRLVIENVGQSFEKDKGETTDALKDVNFEVKDGEFVCIIGPSGCGKTTLLRIVAGLDRADSGSILLDGETITSPDPRRGMVFQEYSLFPWRTVMDNVTFGLDMGGMDRKESRKIAEEYLRLVGLEQFRDSYPYELSGGMRQRIAIVRALANDPAVLLMDEPFGSLDAQTRNKLQQELLQIWESKKITILFVTHSVDEAVFLSDRIAVMTSRPGRIKEMVDVDLPRPRDRTSTSANKLRNRLLNMLAEENK
ncbi:ABC transporter ATP-binding protein [Methanohalophilus portucalensis]|uniref:Molybdate/tungstate import ATP-binding protein WtpC n=2 Tax=Methanohalophilus portucalensis TaxID=39664 RepID=A0A1L9C5J7_9EURY|nr:ABC transporter ATP-binding protein [Methanohalophilus portucalensis]ATU08457.1 nitrate ABC transporter ATP-binding protein [Methanohalophilus portucalensis]OJH49805.1 nitrate ABC transporter ATP-binding protein [Methanohalophilus portucalensis FDF-1]RNI13376.1 ABC transporter ATP-binding protein [Methanohalophilus portucalensis FDF-1]SMH33703.1 NitT/TauT family transport system ATP-binding protein [Methanohalophilus portucalensis FDF-1]